MLYSDGTHLDEAERITFLHKAFNAAADLLETGLVLADLGDVLLNCRPVSVTVSTCAFPQSSDEAEHFGLHLFTQPGQALLRVVQKLLNKGSNEGRIDEGKVHSTKHYYLHKMYFTLNNQDLVSQIIFFTFFIYFVILKF